jgi:hypothetical protein
LISPNPAVDALGATVMLWVLMQPVALRRVCRQ